MTKLLPILLALVGLVSGLAAGVFLAEPAPVVSEETEPDPKDSEKSADDAKVKDSEDESASDFIKLNNQFVVPLVEDGDVVSLVVLSLSLEVEPGNEETVYSREPKLRDAFLRVLFDHANSGGFSGEFTKSTNMIVLRDALNEIAQKTLGPIIKGVLIVDLVRQDV